LLLPLSENLSLIYASSAGEGKTKGMAKGAILCHGKDVFSGESAGFGLPVLKTEKQTIFPSLFSTKLSEAGIIEAVYHLNLINTWQIMGAEVPPYFRGFMEQLVRYYMNRPDFQRSGLKIRNSLLKILRIQSTMKPGKSYGYCRVLFQTEDLQLKINVKGKALLHLGELILLNEVPGIGFSRFINRTESGWNIRDGNNFLPWQTCTIETAVENPCLRIGFFLSVPDKPDSRSIQIAVGREVGRALNWAGLSITAEQAVFTYHVNFYSRKNDWFEAMPIPYG
jgi:hypothetical protein